MAYQKSWRMFGKQWRYIKLCTLRQGRRFGSVTSAMGCGLNRIIQRQWVMLLVVVGTSQAARWSLQSGEKYSVPSSITNFMHMPREQRMSITSTCLLLKRSLMQCFSTSHPKKHPSLLGILQKYILLPVWSCHWLLTVLLCLHYQTPQVKLVPRSNNSFTSRIWCFNVIHKESSRSREAAKFGDQPLHYC